eukprot:g8922.t1
MVLLLVETAAGFALFKVLKEKKLRETKDLWKDFETPSKAQKIVELKAFSKFEGTYDALEAASAILDSNINKGLKKFLKKKVKDEELAVQDSKLGNIIKEELGIPCIHNPAVMELARGVRNQMESLIPGLASSHLALGLSHSISRYKLKFSPDKVDVMIIQAIALLEDMDKEINVYAMRVREWYGWHFPEMGKIVQDNIIYAKTICVLQFRENAQEIDLSSLLNEELEEKLKQAAMTSMGTEISHEDMSNITDLCSQLIDLAEYRAQLYEYLSNRMKAIAPNLTVLVGELIGAKLISHAGSLMNLAKHSGASIQMLGAEKALFRALKTRTATPKYGVLFHSSFVGSCSGKYKGKIARLLAAKTALVSRVDALAEEENEDIGVSCRAQIQNRIAKLENQMVDSTAKSLKSKQQIKMETTVKSETGVIQGAPVTYNTAADVITPQQGSEMEVESTVQEEPSTKRQKKDKKKKKKQAEMEVDEPVTEETTTPEVKRTKRKGSEEVEEEEESRKPKKQKKESSSKKKKDKKSLSK